MHKIFSFPMLERKYTSNLVKYRKEVKKMVQAYCVKCKAKQEMNDPKEITMKNGKPAVQGICPVCGTKMFKIGAAK